MRCASHELSDSEIIDLYGDLFAEADRAFRTDPEYVCQIAEAAGKVIPKWSEQRRREIEVYGKSADNREEQPEPLPQVIPDGSMPTEVVFRRQSGETVAEVAQALFISETTVKRISREAGFKARRPNQQMGSLERTLRNQRIRIRFSQSGNVAHVAQEFGLSRTAVRKVLGADTSA